MHDSYVPPPPVVDPTEALVRSYQRRLRRLRTALAVETAVAVPVVGILAFMLIASNMHRGQVAAITFGTALEVTVRDEGAANRVLDSLRRRAGGGTLAPGSVTIEPAPTIRVVPRDDREIATEIDAVRAIEACREIKILMDAAIVKVAGEPIVAAPSAEEAQMAIDALVDRYRNVEGLIAPPRVVSKVELVPERRPPARVKFNRDELVTIFRTERVPDAYEFVGPDTTVDGICKKWGLSRDQLQLMNRNTNLASLKDGDKLRVKAGSDNLEVEYQANRSEIRELPPTEKRVEDPTLRKGTSKLVKEGKAGQHKVTYRITFRNDREVKCEVVATEVLLPAEERVVNVGTGTAEAGR